ERVTVEIVLDDLVHARREQERVQHVVGIAVARGFDLRLEQRDELRIVGQEVSDQQHRLCRLYRLRHGPLLASTALSRGRVAPAQAGHGWLAAIAPADARRFRVDDPALSETLRFAGAELTEDAPDVEIGPAPRGDAGCAVVVVSDVRPEGGRRVARAIVRSA